MFWIPRNSHELLGLNTNLELGIFLGRTLFARESTHEFPLEFLGVGWPNNAERMGLVRHYLSKSGLRPFTSLTDLCSTVAQQYNDNAPKRVARRENDLAYLLPQGIEKIKEHGSMSIKTLTNVQGR